MCDRVLQKLPNPLVKADAAPLQSAGEWISQRGRILELVAGLEYGALPPKPEEQECELLCFSNDTFNTYALTIGNGKERFSFELQLVIPPHDKGAQLPVVLNGDGCWRYMDDSIIDAITGRGFIAARFNRAAIVHDVYSPAEARRSPLYRLYPGIESGTIAGWAWGYQRCIDALLQLPMVDPACIAITGHSRGGKAVLLAGAADGRVAFTAPNGSGAAGAGCWRYQMHEPRPPDGNSNEGDRRSEVLADLLKGMPHWLGPKMRDFEGHEEQLPFDQHYLKALIAPRYYIQTEGLADTWANPKGAYQTLLAARGVYHLLGASDRLLSHYREGGHAHTLEDFEVLLNVMSAARAGREQDKCYYENPYPKMEKIFDWDC
ncbi:MAG: hypothetical protein LBU00_01200 [Treponema sp.]|jgi:hypothetical protein|nr:hypothetical protein [Treponema sp.]